MRDITTTKPNTRRASSTQYKPYRPTRRAATTTEARENQLMALAYDLAEDQLRNKTASAQVITHFLKLATEKERLEREKLENENQLLIAKKKSIEASDRMEALYADALAAFTSKYEWQGDDTGSET